MRLSKAERRKLKAVYQIHKCVNFVNEKGAYEIDRAKRRAKSFWFYSDLQKKGN